MTTFGYKLSSEEFSPRELVEQAVMAEEAGFEFAVISDHFHPWIDRQGHSPFVWSVIGAIAQATERLRVGTGVTCPTMRIHPALVAQAAATSASLLPGRFFLGVGSGENLNEHVTGHRWPPAAVRLEMLEEAIGVIRLLLEGGTKSHHGKHFTLENARLYDLPDEPLAIYVAAAGERATKLAARAGDGLITVGPAEDTVSNYRDAGGDGPALTEATVCYHPDEAQARKLVKEMWPNAGLPGELGQELRTPAHFEQAAELVTEEAASSSLPVGPDPEVHIAGLRRFVDAGYDQVFIHQIGPDQEAFVDFYRREVLPKL